MLVNANFEMDWAGDHACHVFPSDSDAYFRDIGNIFVPEGWTFWFNHDPGVFDQPEGRDAHKSHDPVRVHNGNKAYMYFTFYRKHDAGLYQKVNIEPGTTVKFSAHAHAWSNWHDGPHPDDPRWSEGAGYDSVKVLEGNTTDDDMRNFTFRIGIDPTGGINPNADTVVWGQGAHIYNEYHKVPEVEITAEAEVITVFLRSKTLWPFKHNDAYWDNALLEKVQSDEPGVPGRGLPRVQYKRVYILFPPNATNDLVDKVSDVVWDSYRPTLGGSADDAGIGDLDNKSVIAIDPKAWGDGLPKFYEDYYPHTEYKEVVYQTTTQLLGRVLAHLAALRGLKLEYPLTRVPPAITSEFGVNRKTYYHKGLDLAASWNSNGDEVLAAYDGEVLIAGRVSPDSPYGFQIRTKTILPDGQEMLIRYAHLTGSEGIYVETGDKVKAGQEIGRPDSTGNSTGDHLHIDVKINDQYVDPEVLIDWDIEPKPQPPTPTKDVIIGMHDFSGGMWMSDNSIRGYCLIHHTLQQNPLNLDYRYLQEKGIVPIVRLAYGYANGTGTLPRPDGRYRFVDAVIRTINNAQGVEFWHVGNEPNNRQEFPGFNSNDEYPLTPEYVTEIYNEIYNSVSAKLGPPPLDPYFGPGSNNKDWWLYILDNIDGAEAIFLHAKTQTNNPQEVWSRAKFSHDPLKWQYLNMRVVETYYDMLPNKYRDLPIIITELNPQTKNGELGWKPENSRWIEEVMKYLQEFGKVDGVCFYRYEKAGDQIGFALEDKPILLNKIKEYNI